LTLGCREPAPPEKPWVIRPTQTWQPDALALQGSLRNLRRVADGYVVVSTQTHTIYKLDDSLRLVWRFGREGKGPEEFTRYPNIYPQGEHLYALDGRRLHVLRLSTGQQVERQVWPKAWPRGVPSDQLMVDRRPALWYAPNLMGSPGGPQVQRVGLGDEPQLHLQWGRLGGASLGKNIATGIPLVLPDRTFLWLPDHIGGIERMDSTGQRIDSLPVTGREGYARLRPLVRTIHDQLWGGNWEMTGWRIFNNPLVWGDCAIVGTLRDDRAALSQGGPVRGRWMVLRWHPQLEYLGAWETDPAHGHLYQTFCLAADSLSLLAYEEEQGVFHRIPIPAPLLERMKQEK